jgi:hypothetical protein
MTDNGSSTSSPGVQLVDEALTSVQSQVGMILTAVAAIIAFIFHKDFSAVVPAVTTLAFAVYGAAVAVARAWKHNTVVQAQVALQGMKLGAAQDQHIQSAFDAVADHNQEIEARVRALEAIANAAQKVAAPRKTAQKTTRTRRKPPPY